MGHGRHSPRRKLAAADAICTGDWRGDRQRAFEFDGIPVHAVVAGEGHAGRGLALTQNVPIHLGEELSHDFGDLLEFHGHPDADYRLGLHFLDGKL